MSSHGPTPLSTIAAASNAASNPVEPRPLELSLNPENGSLLTVPLTQVLLATTDALYQDIYNMAHGELEVTTAAQLDADQQKDEDEPGGGAAAAAASQPQVSKKRERMSNLSFAQRRHELAWRLAKHGRALQHVAGLTAADASSDFGNSVKISSTALQHARTAWVQADEAQDAMYFFHAQLFPARAAPHDVYGAADVHLTGQWFDLPADLRLGSDRYETVPESQYSKQEVDERWQMAVRQKLLSGEVAWRKRQGGSCLFDLSLAGGVLKLTHGAPRKMGGTGSGSGDWSFPIQALLTIVSSSEMDEWTLLSLDVRVEAKTGEFNHQLEASNRQRYNLHRLAAIAMAREEERVRKLKKAKEQEQEQEQDEANNHDMDHLMVPQPLHALFQVAHIFSLSWQLELLSAQAQALRRGAWSAGEGNQINVTPVQFLDDSSSSPLLGAVSISFWRVDDAYGPPSVDDLIADDNNFNDVVDADLESTTQDDDNSSTQQPQSQPFSFHQQRYKQFLSSQQLVLSIRAEKSVGIKVALSGGLSIRQREKYDATNVGDYEHTQQVIARLLEAATNPFALSASDALLAATQLCTGRKCHATVAALQKAVLPPWITLRAERGNISVAVRVEHYGVTSSLSSLLDHGMPVLFRLACDARTGAFAPTFPRAMKLLRYLACNDIRATECVALRIASTPVNRQKAASAKSTGRLVKEAFDGLVRSMNLLGQRVGVGGRWNDKDAQSASIRDRSIGLAAKDVMVSLTKCCGLAALFGLTPLAIGTSLGVNGTPDVAGEAITQPVDGVELFATPPLAVMLDQQVIEMSRTTSDGLSARRSYLQQRFLGVSFACTDQALTLYPLDITVQLDSPHHTPLRKSCSLLSFCAPDPNNDEADVLGLSTTAQPLSKRIKLEENGHSRATNQTNDRNQIKLLDLPAVVPHFAGIFSATIDLQRHRQAS